MPVFDAGSSATENSLLTNNRSLYVENNYGYQDPFGPSWARSPRRVSRAST